MFSAFWMPECKYYVFKSLLDKIYPASPSLATTLFLSLKIAIGLPWDSQTEPLKHKSVSTETANDRPSRSMSSRGKFLIISYMLSNCSHLKATFSISFTVLPCSLTTCSMCRYRSDQNVLLILFPHLKG